MSVGPTKEQASVLENKKKNLIVSASAGSGKTWVLIKYITSLIIEKKVPIKKLLVLTFTRAAAGEMRERLNKSLYQERPTSFLLEQIDDLSTADICTIDAFCEKLIRRNTDKLETDEGFKIMEDTSEVKLSAFNQALIEFENVEPESLQEIYYCFRKNKDYIFNVIQDINNFLSANKDSEKLLDYYINNQAAIFDKALNVLNEDLKCRYLSIRQEIVRVLDIVESEDKYISYLKVLDGILAEPGDDFIENVKQIRDIDLPNIPIIRGERRDEDLANEMKAIRLKIKGFVESFDGYNFDDYIYRKQRFGCLATSLLKLFKLFKIKESQLKQSLDILDFVDIEAGALKLLEDNDVLISLQEKYDYVFVDEYQDTNRIQEAIIKPLTTKGHFIAVGDPKQGIYGFRNATMEIMQQDIQEFSSQKESDVVYLRGNFRSDNRLLSFINRIFEKVMTEERVGIDYINTSLLRGEMPFDKMALPSVRVDIVVEKEEETESETKGVYSVKEAEIVLKEKNKLEVDTIVARIDELLLEKIYDERAKRFRTIRCEDIAVLFRNRGTLMRSLATALMNKGYPVQSDEKNLEIEEPEVQMLVNLLRILINFEDDVALISVMNSQLGGFTLDELALLRQNHPEEKCFFEIINNETQNQKIVGFINELEDLRLKCSVDGLYKALNQFFVEKDYFSYLKYHSNSKLLQVEHFLQDIRANELDFNIPNAIKFFSSIGGKLRSPNSSGGDAIKLMTIHASKGLEYPVVILAGAGKRLDKPNTQNYNINANFGLGTYAFDERQNLKCTTPVYEAIKLENHKKEMIDEIMIFYVALTRAKNHLYIVGGENTKNLIINETFNVLDAKNYLQMIAFALGRPFIENLEKCQTVTAGDWEFNIVNETVNLKRESTRSMSASTINEEAKKKLSNYFNFSYNGSEVCKLNLKNTVTGINSSRKEEFYEKYVESEGEQNFINLGNAYHEALKLLDFSGIVDNESLKKELEKNKPNFTEGYYELIDENILLKNIILINSIIKESKLYKEKQFVMYSKIKDITEIDSEEKVLVQGVVDLFSLGKENILIDYKFTHEKNQVKIIKKYSKQLDLYSLAIEQGFNITLDKKYILSLKNAELIEYFE